jgi:hypothetical protein
MLDHKVTKLCYLSLQLLVRTWNGKLNGNLREVFSNMKLKDRTPALFILCSLLYKKQNLKKY